MKILLVFFTFSLISGAVRCFTVTGYSGGSLLVDSREIWYNDAVKYMAKLPEWRPIINDTKHDKWINEGQFTLFKNNERKLMIYIRELKRHDAGRYAIDVHHNRRVYMTLNVEEDSCCNVSKRVMVNIGETATFSCEYSQNHINDPKIIFKEGEDSIETIYSTSNKSERFSVSDDRHTNLFTVRITAVTPDDGGVYLCGVWIYRHSYSYSIINTLHLHVVVSSDVSMIISIWVCVSLLLIGGFTLTVCKLRHRRRGDAHTHSSDRFAVQLPTILSDGLLYTSVSFQKLVESLGEASVTVSKNELYSDYTTIMYRTRLN